MTLSTIFQLYRGAVSFIGEGNRNTRREKNIDLPQIVDKLHHTMLYRVHLASRHE